MEQHPARFAEGAAVRAVWGDDDNEPCWYPAILGEQETAGGDTQGGGSPRFWVSLADAADEDEAWCVDIGDIMLMTDLAEGHDGGRESDARGRAEQCSRSRSRSRSRDRGRDDCRRADRRRGGEGALAQQYAGLVSVTAAELQRRVLEAGRAASSAQGRDYGGRVASYKLSLALRQDTYTARRRSRSPDRRTAVQHVPAGRGAGHWEGAGGGNGSVAPEDTARAGGGNGEAAGGAATSEQRRRLEAVYGDASATH
jgi:hypothetical protein